MVWSVMWDPFMELEKLKERIDIITEELGDGERFKSSLIAGIGTKIPPIDMWKKDGSLIIETDIPGVTKEDINLKLTEESFSVSAKKRKDREEEKEGVYRSERRWESYRRSTSLPIKINPKEAKANFKDGTLRIEVPILKEGDEKEVKVEIKQL